MADRVVNPESDQVGQAKALLSGGGWGGLSGAHRVVVDVEAPVGAAARATGLQLRSSQVGRGASVFLHVKLVA